MKVSLPSERLWPALVLLLAVVVILPGLWSFGFWEPHEIRIADEARAELEAAGEPDEGAADEPRPKSRRDRIAEIEPPLTQRAIMAGVERLGVSEVGARLPLALLGIIAVVATFFVGLRLAGPRAGLVSALVLISFPLLLFQSRQLMSNIGAVTGSAVMMVGLVGMAWPRPGRAWWLYPIDAVLVAAGAAVSFYAAGAFLGLLVPLSAVGVASLVALAHDRGEPDAGAAPRARVVDGDRRRQRRHLWLIGGGCALAALAVLGVVLAQIFEMRDPVPGTRQILGKSFIPTEEPSRWLGGVWSARDDLDATFDVLFEQIAYGLFPWVALAPIAVARLAFGPRGDRRAWAGYVVLVWAACAWLVATIMARKVGPVHYPALAAVAIAIGMWIDDLLTARRRADETGDAAPQTRRQLGLHVQLPLVALFVLLAAVTLGKDLQAFPERITNLHMLDGGPAYPAGSSIKRAMLLFGGLFGALLAAGLWLWRPVDPTASVAQTLRYWTLRAGPHALVVAAALLAGLKTGGGVGLAVAVPVAAALAVGVELLMRSQPGGRPRREPGVRAPWYPAGRHGVSAALAVGVLFALFITQVWTPRLSQAFSSKHLFSVFRDLRASEDQLVVMGKVGTGPDWYAGTDYETLKNREALLSALERDERVFAVVPASELCAVHRAASKRFDYYVHDDSHSTLLLMSNRLRSGEVDRNPLATAIVRERPTDIQHPMSVNFDDRIELIGYNMPRRVGVGQTFELKLFYKVLKPVGGSWKIFVHLDRGAIKINGDHDPIGGRCSTSYWQPGDYIVDSHEITAGDRVGTGKGAYRVFTGFFVGSSGNWRNMKVVSGEADKDDRVPLGTIDLR